MPASASWRSRSLEKLNELTATLFLHFNLDIAQALKMRESDVSMVFDSKAFGEWKKARDGRNKLDMAVIDRLDALNKNIGNLGKVLAAR